MTTQAQNLHCNEQSTHKTAKLLKRSLLGVSSLILIACGSGGSSSGPATSIEISNADFTPNSERLMEDAGASSELYVEEGFTFDHTQVTQLSVSIYDANSTPLPFTRLNVYLLDTGSIEGSMEEWSDEWLEHAQLISGGMSNADGVFTRVLEFPQHQQGHPMLLVEVNAVGMENKKLLTVDSDHTSVSFEAI